jgi:hypothetical protein
MINGHIEYTQELNDEELMLAKRLVSAFKKRTKDNPVTAPEIVSGVNANVPLTQKFSERRLRKIINYYRVQGILPIISTSKGYHTSYEVEDIQHMITSLSQRANSILEACYGLQRIIEKQKK